ncbi:MAG: TonB-dependent receptor plug domain-containing protein, partial [Verrucomicrobiota bacterium]
FAQLKGMTPKLLRALEELFVTVPELSTSVDGQVSATSSLQSATVLTRQRLDDQNLVAIADILKHATGITVQRFDGAGHFNSYHARGYAIDSLQLDGIAFGNTGNVTEFDAAVYDRVEILRGPAGLFQGAGEPGAALNLARKRALSLSRFAAAATVGSWSARRLELDATGSLAANGRLRGRAVVVADERESYQDYIESSRRVAYATLEYDLGASTTASRGRRSIPSSTRGFLLTPTVACSMFRAPR